MPIHVQKLENRYAGQPATLSPLPTYLHGLRKLPKGALSVRNLQEAVELLCEYHESGRLEQLILQVQEGALTCPWRYPEFRHLGYRS